MKQSFNTNKFKNILAGLLLLSVQSGFAQETGERETDENRSRMFPAVDRVISESTSPRAFKILFIGNSLLYGGNVPGAFLSLIRAKDAQAAVNMREVVGGNYTLKNHIENGVAVNAIDNEGPWDYVVLQEQSSHLGNDPAKSIEETRPLAAHILSNHSKVVVFDAWVRLVNPDYAQLNMCNAQLAQKLGAQRVPVLMALAQAKSISGVKLLKEDGHHLDSEGVYLVACVIYAQLLRRSPVGLPNKLILDDEVVCEAEFNRAKLLQAVAAVYAK